MPQRLKDIAELVGGDLAGEGNVIISGVAKIEEAKTGDITFVANPKYARFLSETKASAVIIPVDSKAPVDKPVIRSKNPYWAFMKVVSAFYPPKPLIEAGVHHTAIIGEGAELGNGLSIGAYVVIGRRCRIGDRSVIMPGVVLGDHVVVGTDCVIHANVCIREDVVLGNRVVLHNGTVIGADGFGFALEDGKYHKVPQVGTVVIEDDVEIGANTTIDRATLGETRIMKGAKLDNLIQVAHNCTVGQNTVIAAQAGLSGSTHIGNGVRIGGQAGIAGHLDIGDFATLGAQAGVSRSVPSGTMVSGYPARPHREELRIEAVLHRLPELLKEIRALKEKIEKMEQERK
jgi:UDP-3-O-[3-hydroxymyristoyl] glucosamine N-acyltransferase